MLLMYAIYQQDIVFILGQSSGMFIYVRNLQLIRSEHNRSVRQNAATQESKAMLMASDRSVASIVQQRKAA